MGKLYVKGIEIKSYDIPVSDLQGMVYVTKLGVQLKLRNGDTVVYKC